MELFSMSGTSACPLEQRKKEEPPQETSKSRGGDEANIEASCKCPPFSLFPSPSAFLGNYRVQTKKEEVQ